MPLLVPRSTIREHLKPYFHSISWLFFEKLFRLFAGMAVGIWLARYLGPLDFGLLSYAQSLVLLFTPLVSLGLDGPLVRELVKHEDQASEILASAFCLKLTGAIIAIIVLQLLSHFVFVNTASANLISILSFSIYFQALTLAEIYFQSRVLNKFTAISSLLAVSYSSILKVLLILLNSPLIYFAYAIISEYIVLLVSLFYFSYQLRSKPALPTNPFFDWHPDFTLAKKLIRDSWPFALSNMVVMIYLKIDQVMLNSLLGSDSVGQYAAAARLSESWYFIPTVICSTLFPTIVKAKSESHDLYFHRLQRLYNLLTWLSVALAIPTTFLAAPFISLFFGPAYHPAARVLSIHIWAGIFVSLSIASGKWYITEHLAKLAFYRNLLGAGVNIILNFALIPLYGITGAAFATLISYAIASYFFDAFTKKTRPVFLQKTRSLFFVDFYRTTILRT